MASVRQHLSPERIFYTLAALLGAAGALGYAVSYVRDDWSAQLPVLPFYLVVLAGSCTLTAVTFSLLRFFGEDPDER